MLSFFVRNQVVRAQSFYIEGKLFDTISQTIPQHAVIGLFKTKDSSLIHSTSSGTDGKFYFTMMKREELFLLIRHVSYNDLYLPIHEMKINSLKLGQINLVPRIKLLDAIEITHQIPVMRIRNDTIEYNVNATKIKINASVEDLLKLLPGVYVNQKGEIIVNGEKVQKILIDGEDFFSETPTVTTKNLRADIISKVEILNKKSNQAAFTGIDDGNSIKALNLTLKKNKKESYFLNGEMGTNYKYYNNNGMAGRFKANEKFAMYFGSSNNGQTDLSNNDQINTNVEDVYSTNTESLDNAQSEPMAVGGIPAFRNAGMHYSNKWNQGLQHFNGNYRYDQSIIHPASSTLIQEIAQDTVYLQRSQAVSNNRQEAHNFSGIYDLILDSTSALKISVGALNKKIISDNVLDNETMQNMIALNNSRQTNNAVIKNSGGRASVLWTKKGKLEGKTFSAQAGIQNLVNQSDGFLLANNYFFNQYGSVFKKDTIDQEKKMEHSGNSFDVNLVFTDRLWKDASVSLAYGMNYARQHAVLNTLAALNGKYVDFIDSLSSNYSLNVLTQQSSVNFQIKKEKFTYTIGGEVSYSIYHQSDFLNDTFFHYNYINFYPRLHIRYNANNSKSFYIMYAGNTQQPALYQLQTLRNNNDPLNIFLGNPALRPAFNHNFIASMNSYQASKNKYLYVGFNFIVAENSISNKSNIDSLGRKISEPINVNGNLHTSLFINSGKKSKLLNIDWGMNGNISYARSVNYVNDNQNVNNNYAVEMAYKIGRNVPEKYFFSLSTTLTYIYSVNSIDPGLITKYWTQEHSFQIGINMPWNLEWNSDYNFSWRQKIYSTDKNNSMMLWNMSLNKKILQNRMTLKVSYNNILDQNTGINRYVNDNKFYESTYTAIGRYFIASIIIHFANQE